MRNPRKYFVWCEDQDVQLLKRRHALELDTFHPKKSKTRYEGDRLREGHAEMRRHKKYGYKEITMPPKKTVPPRLPMKNYAPRIDYENCAL